jgi:putative FmdB family regulatory protein
MPIYEYRCHGCTKKVSVFQRSMTAVSTPRCPECGGGELSRLVSQFAFHRGVDFDDGPEFDDEAFMDGVDENDPASVARWARQTADRMGEELPPDFDDQLAGMDAGGLGEDFGGDDWGG